MNSFSNLLPFLASLTVLCCCLVDGNNLENVQPDSDHLFFISEDPDTGHHSQCVKCPPGFYVKEPCFLDEHDTTCAPCPAESFMPQSNGFNECFKCTVCSVHMSAVCTSTDDTECKACKDGYYWHGHYCKPHKSCPLGRGVKQLGSRVSNTICEHCKPGNYSDDVSTTQTCQPLTNCQEEGLITITQGNRYEDTKCGPDVTTPKSHISSQKVNTKVYPALQKQVKTTTMKSVSGMKEIATTKRKLDDGLESNFFNDELKDYFEEDLPLDEETNRHHGDAEKTNGKHPGASPHAHPNADSETLFNVQELQQSVGHADAEKPSGSGLAAGILGAGCLFMLILIVLLYQRKKQVQERQRLKKKRNELPQWQKGQSDEQLSSAAEKEKMVVGER